MNDDEQPTGPQSILGRALFGSGFPSTMAAVDTAVSTLVGGLGAKALESLARQQNQMLKGVASRHEEILRRQLDLSRSLLPTVRMLGTWQQDMAAVLRPTLALARSTQVAHPSVAVNLNRLLSPAVTSFLRRTAEMIRQWVDLARVGDGLVRARARARLILVLKARDAVLHGRRDEVVLLIEVGLGEKATGLRVEAVALALLDADLLPVDAITDAHTLLEDIRRRANLHKDGLKPLWERRCRGYLVDLLDRPVRSRHGTAMTLLDRHLCQLGTGGLPVSDLVTIDRPDLCGWDDPRIDRLMTGLAPDERSVLFAYIDGHRPWVQAAAHLGLPPELGVSVRRKCRRIIVRLAVREEQGARTVARMRAVSHAEPA